MSVRYRADVLVQGKVIGFFITGSLGLFDTWQKSVVKAVPIQTFPIIAENYRSKCPVLSSGWISRQGVGARVLLSRKARQPRKNSFLTQRHKDAKEFTALLDLSPILD
jgi:hypothetical protein